MMLCTGLLLGQSACEKAQTLLPQIEASRENDLPKAVKLAEKALELAIQCGDIDLEAEIREHLRISTKLTGDIPKAMEMTNWLIEYCHAHGEPGCMGNKLNHMALDIRRFGDLETAHRYLDQALPDCIAAKDTLCISTNYDHRGIIFIMEKRFEEAEVVLNKCLAIRTEARDTIGLGFLYNNLAWLYSETDQSEIALDYLFKSLDIRETRGDRWAYAININNIAELYFSLGKIEESIEWFEKAIPLAKEVAYPDLEQHAISSVAKSYEAIGNYKKAYNLLVESVIIRDSLNSQSLIDATAEMETKYETELKEQKIVVQQLEIEKKEERNKLQLFAGIGLFSLLLFSGSFLWYKNKSEEKERLQKAQLSHQEELLKTAFEVQEGERSRIARDLHDGIGAKLSSLKMTMSSIAAQDNSNSELQRITSVLNDTTEEVRSISHQMMPRALTTAGLIPALEDLISSSFINSEVQSEFDYGELKTELGEQEKIAIYRIAQELIANIIKHANATEFNLQLYRVKDKIMMIAEDNGKGFTVSKLAKGHGLSNIESRAQAIGAKSQFESKEGEGTLFSLSLPV